MQRKRSCLDCNIPRLFKRGRLCRPHERPFFYLACIVLLLFYVIWVYLNDILFLLEIICHIIRFLNFEIFHNIYIPY